MRLRKTACVGVICIKGNKMKIGQDIWYLNFKENKVCKATLIGLSLEETGYVMATHKDDVIKRSNQSVVFQTEDEALSALRRFKPLSDKMQEIIDNSEKEINNIRKSIIGEPECVKELY